MLYFFLLEVLLAYMICLFKSLSLVITFIRYSLHLIYSGTQDFAFEILKILILLCFQKVFQPAIEQFAPGMM